MAIIYNNGNNATEALQMLSAPSRLMLLMRKYVIENRRNMLMIAGCYLAILIISGILGGYTSEFSTRGAILFITILCGGGLLAISASLLFNDMAHKDSRIGVIMLPAECSQKFWSRLLVILPGTILLIIAGYFALGYSNALTQYILYGIWRPIFNIGEIPTANDPAWIFVISFLILEYAFYLFGAVAWPRYSFLKSCGILWGASMVMSILALYTIKWTGILYWTDARKEIFIWSLNIAMLLAASALICGAIYLLRRKTPSK